eukprot:scaffold23711_cov34-Attheya_sp.AAC.3
MDDGSYGTTPSQGMDPDDTKKMDIVDVEFCLLLRYSTFLIQMTDDGSYGTFIALLLTVHVSPRSRMTAHMEPHPAREWIQMTPMDIITDPDDNNGHR